MIVLVCGPPCSGKTTYIRQHARPDDLVVEFDDIAQRLGSPVTHDHHFKYRKRAEFEMQRLLDQMAAGMHPNAWVSRTLPEGYRRKVMADRIHADRTILLLEPRALLVERAQSRRDPVSTIAVIDRWLSRYSDEPATNPGRALDFFKG